MSVMFVHLLLTVLLLTVNPVENTFTEVCPASGIQPRGATFAPGGIILTYFDRDSIWVYNIDRNTRYPLPDTAPCGSNCHLSQDARWITYLNSQDRTISKMRMDGTQRTALASNASDVSWWSADTLLVWTPTQDAYLRPEGSDEREILNADGVVSIQPGGRWGLLVEQAEDEFQRSLINLETRDLALLDTSQAIPLGVDRQYFNAAAWSPDGAWLAFVAPAAYDEANQISGAEIFAVRPGDTAPTQWTNLFARYGAVRINGHSPGELSWSSDGRYLAFWVIELLGPNPEGDAGAAVLHILDVQSGEIRYYCGFSTTEHTPNPPRLVWSPDNTHIAFGGNIPADDKGYLLLALNVETGALTELSSGIYPALGAADVIAWGLP